MVEVLLELISTPALSNKQGQNCFFSLNSRQHLVPVNSTAIDNTTLITDVEHFLAVLTSSEVGIVAELRDETGETIGGNSSLPESQHRTGVFQTAPC
jgi:hypothetical protein